MEKRGVRVVKQLAQKGATENLSRRVGWRWNEKMMMAVRLVVFLLLWVLVGCGAGYESYYSRLPYRTGVPVPHVVTLFSRGIMIYLYE